MHWELDLLTAAQPTWLPIERFPASLLYGYGVYTTFRYPLADRWLTTHWERLQQNAAHLHLELPIRDLDSKSLLKSILQHMSNVSDTPVIRLSVIADIDHYGDFYEKAQLPARLLLSVRPAPPVTARKRRLKTIRYQRPLPGIKLTPIAELIHWKRQAQAEGFDDILLVNSAGHISEASTSNIFFMQGERLFTPEPQRDACLPGITRLQVLEAARHLNLFVSDEPVAHPVTPGWDAAFLCNAAQGLVAVESIDTIHLPWPEDSQERFHALQASLAQVQQEP